MRECKECKKMYDGFLISHSNKYCSEECRKTVRARVNINNKLKRLQRISQGDKDYIANDVYIKYKQRSPNRGLVFDLTVDFFRDNIKANCYYCNEIINKVGFDRLDNSIGYTEENSVPCCVDCNLMKRSMNLSKFIEKCKAIAVNHK